MKTIKNIVNDIIAEAVTDIVMNDCIDKNGCRHDENGRFCGKNGSMKDYTADEEKQKKIDSVNIDFYKDNILPSLNIEEQNLLNLSDIPVRIKHNRLWANQKHFDVNGYDDDYIIGSALYKPDVVLPAKRTNSYHFIAELGNNKNSLVLLDIEYNKNDNYLDIIHHFYIDDNKILQLKRNK